MTCLRHPKRGYTTLLKEHVTCGYLMQWMHCGTFLMQWVLWPALDGQRKRGSISNDQLLISLAGRDNSKCVGGGGESHNVGITSYDPDLLFLVPSMGIDPSGGTRLYTNTSTEKGLKNIVRHYQHFTHTFWLFLTQN